MKEKQLPYVLALAGAVTAGILLTLAAASPLAAHGSAEEKIYRVEGDVEKPVRLGGNVPTYPEQARKERIEGRVVVRAVIDREGNVATTEVVEAEREDLGAAAAEAIRTWTFEPATLEGEPVPVYYHLTVNFRLDADKPAEGDGDGDGDGDDQEPSLR